jgi:hypothetical protein
MQRSSLIAILYAILLILMCFLSLTSQIAENSSSKSIYFVTSNEGVGSHMRQLFHLWAAGMTANRSIDVVGFHAHRHYPDVPVVHVCDLFQLPSTIRCTTESNLSILTNHKCTYTSTLHPPSFYGWDGLVLNRSQRFNYRELECLAGQFSSSDNPVLNNTAELQAYVNAYLPRPMFAKKYLDMLPQVKQALGVGKGDYATVHWRRGDQLWTRCKNADISTNCDNEKRFVEDLQAEMENHIPKSKMKKLTTYIATNEHDGKRLNHLIRNDFKLFYHIRKEFLKVDPPMHMSTLDVFMVELLLMCNARYFFSWGVSAVHEFMFNHCRDLRPESQQITVCNGTRLNESYKIEW